LIHMTNSNAGERYGMKRTIIGLTLLACIAVLSWQHVAAQQVERVYPSYNHSSLFGVVTTDNGRLYAAGLNSILLESVDGGSAWQQIPLGALELHIHQLVTDGKSLFMLAYSPRHFGNPQLWPEGYPSQLFRYDPEAEKITHLSYPMQDNPDPTWDIPLWHFQIAATHEALYLTYNGFIGARHLISRDGGTTWSDLILPDSTGKADSHFITRERSEDIMIFRYLSMEEGRLYQSTDFGSSWRVSPCPLPNRLSSSHYMHFPWLRDDRVLLQSAVDGEIKSMATDGTWNSHGFPPGSIMTLTEDAHGAWIALTVKGGCYRSEDEGEQWVTLLPERLPGPFRSWTPRIAMPDAQTMIITDDYGSILRSPDRGLSWDEPRALDAWVLAVTMADSAFGIAMVRDYKAGKGGAINSPRLTDDGFRTLQPCPPFPLSWAYPVTRSLWYALGPNGRYGDSLICRSTDGGNTWELVLELPNVIAFTTKIDIGDDDAYALATSRGIMYTPDRGETWQHVYEAEWTSQTRPNKINIPGRGEPIWMIPDRSNPFIVVRSDAAWQHWDTVLVLSEEERGLLVDSWGITDFCVTPAGHVYTFALTKSPYNALIHFSDDNGASWQSWLASTDGFEQDGLALLNLPLLRSDENFVMHQSQFMFSFPSVKSFTISSSPDQLRSFEILFEYAINGKIMEVYNLFPSADRRSLFFATGMAVYRITVPESTASAASVSPPLPLSIAVPHPHPLSRRTGNATLFIQSGRPDRVHLQAFDMTGRLVARLYEGELGPDGRHVAWNTATLTPGAYLLQLASPRGVNRRTVVLR
ncbi:MAG: hypothetical protein KFH87_12620, partial [Bacteroidetes bacterium]|nr:hypothetical protein [Bacteroidota bacterium]